MLSGTLNTNVFGAEIGHNHINPFQQDFLTNFNKRSKIKVTQVEDRFGGLAEASS